MDRLHVAFCDDDASFRTILREKTENYFHSKGIDIISFEAGSADELSLVLGHRTFDLIFLDIEMPGSDGIRYGEELRTKGFRADIIYVSNMEDRVYDIFRVHPWTFLRKSRLTQELPAVLEEYASSLHERKDTLLLTDQNGKAFSFDPTDLIYVEAVGKIQKLVFAGSEDPANIRSTIKELNEMLLPYGFIRIHKGFLVNYRFIRKITSRQVLLDTGGDLPVGRDWLNSARESYLALMKWKGLDRHSLA